MVRCGGARDWAAPGGGARVEVGQGFADVTIDQGADRVSAAPHIGTSGNRPERACDADFPIRVVCGADRGRRQAAPNETVSGASGPDPLSVL